MQRTLLLDQNYWIKMARYKGKATTKTIARDYPHTVEIPLPAGGLASRLEAMHDWHLARGIKS